MCRSAISLPGLRSRGDPSRRIRYGQTRASSLPERPAREAAGPIPSMCSAIGMKGHRLIMLFLSGPVARASDMSRTFNQTTTRPFCWSRSTGEILASVARAAQAFTKKVERTCDSPCQVFCMLQPWTPWSPAGTSQAVCVRKDMPELLIDIALTINDGNVKGFAQLLNQWSGKTIIDNDILSHGQRISIRVWFL